MAQRHSVYALDLPGNGKSDKPDEMAYDAVSGAHILAKFIDTLGIGSATLVGNYQVDPIIRTAVRLK